MSRSATLDPTSVPFRPAGGIGLEDGGIGLPYRNMQPPPRYRDQDRSSLSLSGSTLSTSPSEYRSIKSSPSPPSEESHSPGAYPSNPSLRSSVGQNILQHQPNRHSSPSIAGAIEVPAVSRDIHSPSGLPPVEVEKHRSSPEAPGEKEPSLSDSVDSFPDDGPETPGPNVAGMRISNGSQIRRAGSRNLSGPYTNSVYGQSQERLMDTPPLGPVSSSRSSSFTNPIPFMSTSPASSLDSGSQFAAVNDHSLGLERQLRFSPFIQDIIHRLARSESATREIRRDLALLNDKMDLLLQRGSSHGPPEFQDPFATSSIPSTARGSMSATIAPNQVLPVDDVGHIAQRLNTLTSSVGQLLALQTQHQLHVNGPNSGVGPMDLAPNQAISPPLSNPSLLGHGLPSRPDLRSSRMNNAGIRNWSAGSLDFPPRAGDMGGPSPRQDLMRDKQRRSVMGIMRRESAGSENWASGSARESAATLTKWDQLNLVPDLLRSLSKFGVGPPNKIQQRALPFLLKGADIIAQAPPTQERIAAYVIPAIQIVLTHINNRNANVGPTVVMISTTVDQATQAQRMIRDLGGPIGVRSALGVGVASASNDLGPELRLLQQNSPHIICGTPQKLHALFTAPGGLNGSQVRFLVLDEVDQLIARNLHDFVLNIVKGFPPPRSRSLTSIGGPGNSSSPVSQSPYTQSSSSSDSVSANLNTPLQAQVRRLSGFGSPADDSATGASSQIERQSALFSNTVPQDVLNLAQTIQLREPVRVLVRRDGNVTHADTSQGARGLRQFYLYLAFTAGGRPEPLPSAPSGGLGIIGSGRGTSSAETAQAREWKLEALADLFDDIDVHHAIIHVGGMTSLDTVVYKLASKGLEAIPLHGDMNASAKLAALNKFRGPPAVVMRQLAAKVLVVYDVQVKTTEVSQIPLIINYDLPKAVEEYAHRVAPAVATSYARAGVVVNFVTATGGDVEMLRSIECFYKIKCPEVPMSLRDII